MLFVSTEPIILEPAYRHGVSEDEDLDMYIGSARPGHPLLEIGVITWHGIIAINHAMPARARFLR